jgi:creatinine amidohydrolase
MKISDRRGVYFFVTPVGKNKKTEERNMNALIINEMTWPELQAQMDNIKIAFIPVGSCEQHGPNTTFATDAVRAYEFAKLLAEKVGNRVVVFPAVTYGLSLHHMDFPGTVTLRVETMLHLLEDIAVAIHKHGIRKILFLNAHGGNYPALDGVVIQLKQVHDINAYWSAIGSEIAVNSGVEGSLEGLPNIIGHACEIETSQLMYLAPEYVRENRVPSQMQDSMYTRESFVKGNAPWSWKYDVTLNGALGDARKATVEIGKQLTDAALDNLAKLVDEIIAS